MMSKKPNLFIVGAPKAGTSFLYDFLKENNNFYFSKIKELNFFTYDELLAVSYYKDYKVKTLEKYLKHFENSNSLKYIVDSSVSYFNSNEAAVKIKNFNPEAKIIIILRNPIKRAESHYLMDLRMGYTNKSLNEHLKEDINFYYKQYIGNSSYSENVRRFIEAFGYENVLILTLENLELSIQKLSEFLNVPLQFKGDDLKRKVNEKKSAKNMIGKFILKNRGLTERMNLLVPNRIKKILKKRIYKEAEQTRFSARDIERLELLLKSEQEFYTNFLNGRCSY